MAKKRRKLQMQKPRLKLEMDGDIPPNLEAVARLMYADMHGELEVLTEDLIAELMSQGWEEKPLREAQQMGLAYSRKRNSFWHVES
jgi:hypothetical protein